MMVMCVKLWSIKVLKQSTDVVRMQADESVSE